MSFVIHRASCGETKDQVLDANAAVLKKHKVPFGVYHYLKALTVADARAEARVFYASAAAHMPAFWALDCEYGKISTKTKKESGFARRITDAFRGELIELGIDKERIGVYIGHHLYKLWNLDYDSFAFAWIPRYGTNDGKPQKKPDYPYTLWQYTSRGRVEGISDKTLDLNLLNPDGVKRLKWFMGRE